MSRSRQASRVDEPAPERREVPVAGGVLVCEPTPDGKAVVGLKDVTSRVDLAGAFAARNLDVRQVYSLPVLDEGPAGR